MSAFPSTAQANAMLDLIKNDTPKLALFTTNPGPTGSGTEASGGSYARQSVTLSSASGGATSNTNAITFTLPAGTYSYWAIYDATSAGNINAYGALTSPITVPTGGGTATVAIGDIDLAIATS